MFLGDYIDRGDSALETIYRLYEFVTLGREQFVMIMGNHDELLYEFLEETELSMKMEMMGVRETLEQITPTSGSIECLSDIECINELRVIEKHSILSHEMDIEGQRVLFSHSGVVEDRWTILEDAINNEVDVDYSIIGHWGIYDVDATSILSRRGTFTYETCPETSNPYVLITLPTHKIIMIDDGNYNSYVNISAIIRQNK